MIKFLKSLFKPKTYCIYHYRNTQYRFEYKVVDNNNRTVVKLPLSQHHSTAYEQRLWWFSWETICKTNLITYSILKGGRLVPTDYPKPKILEDRLFDEKTDVQLGWVDFTDFINWYHPSIQVRKQ